MRPIASVAGSLSRIASRPLHAPLLTLLVLAACGDPEPIKIGFIGGLSGRSADLGEPSRNAVQLAIAQVNDAGGIHGRPLELLVRDDANDPRVAAKAVRDLHAAGAAAIIGPNNSSIAEGMLPALNELQIVAVSPTVSSLVFADLDDYLFRINWTTRDNAWIYADHYIEQGIDRMAAAIDAQNRVFSESWLKEFAFEYERLGGRVTASDAFDAASPRGYSDTAERLLASDPQAILLIANSVDTAQMAHQIRKLNATIPIIAAEWAASERLLYLGGSAIEGMELVQSYDRNDTSERYAAFRDAYLERFQQEPGYSAIAAYDAATMLFAALRAGDEAVPVRESLLALGAVEGLQQEIKFNEFGDAKRRAFFVTIKDGRFTAKSP